MVAAYESLKPLDPQFRNYNIYHVVEALLHDCPAAKSSKKFTDRLPIVE